MNFQSSCRRDLNKNLSESLVDPLHLVVPRNDVTVIIRAASNVAFAASLIRAGGRMLSTILVAIVPLSRRNFCGLLVP